MKKIIAVLILGVMASCSPKVIMPKQANIDNIATKHPDYTLADAKEGRSLYIQHCATCHGLKRPQDFTEEKWNVLVPAMVKKTNKKAGKEVVDAASSDKILKYVVTMCAAPAGDKK